MTDHYRDAEQAQLVADAASAGGQAVAYAAAQAEATLAVAEQLARIADALTTPAPAAEPYCGQSLATRRPCPDHQPRAYAAAQADAEQPAGVSESPLRALLDRWAADIDNHTRCAAAVDQPAYHRGCAAGLRQAHGALRLVLDGTPADTEPADRPGAAVRPLTADEWNARWPVGTPVHAYPAGRAYHRRVTHTRTPAWTLGNGSAVVSVDGHPGGIALTHIDVIDAEPDPYRDDDARLDQAERDEIDQATVDHERGLTRHAPVVQPAEAGDLVTRQRAAVRAAIDQCAAEYTGADEPLDVRVGPHRRRVAHVVADAVRDARLGQPDWHYLDDVIRAEAELQHYDEWLMATPEARAALTELLCDAPPEPWQHPVVRRAAVPAPRPAVDDADQ